MLRNRALARISTVAVLVVALLSGCTGPLAGHPSPAATVPSDVLTALRARVQPAWRVHAHLIGRPVIADGVIVSYVDEGATGLQVRAWRFSDGTELWSRPAAVGEAVPGIEVTVETIRYHGHAYAPFLAPTRYADPYELMVVRLTTGQPRGSRHPPVRATSRPWACGSEVCFKGWSLDTKHFAAAARPLRLNLRTDRVHVDSRDALPDRDSLIGDGVFVSGVDGRQRLGAVDDGRIRWERPYGQVFGAGATTGGGWNWVTVGGVLVGFGGRAGTMRNGRFVYDYEFGSVVGLDPATGKTRWRLRGAADCPDTDLDLAPAPHLVVLCRARGRISTPHGAVDLSKSVQSGVRLAEIAVDVRTGTVRWSRNRPAHDLVDPSAPVSDKRWQPLRQAGRLLLLDRLTGRVAALPAGAVVACARQRPMLVAPPDPTEPRKKSHYESGAAVSGCALGVLSRFAVRTGGVRGQKGWWVVADSDEFAAYHLG